MARPERLRSFHYIGPHRYSVTCCALNRCRIFDSHERVDPVLTHFLQQAECFRLAIIVCCFMPDHVHVVAEGLTDDADLQSFISRAKQKSGFDFAAKTRRRLWQKGFHDRVLRDDEATQEVVRYVIDNPVRAGLVAHPNDYPFWTSGLDSREQLLEYVQTARHR